MTLNASENDLGIPIHKNNRYYVSQLKFSYKTSFYLNKNWISFLFTLKYR